MKSTKYYIILISLVSFKLYGAVLPVNPGESLYGIVTRIGDELDIVYETTTNIDSKVDVLDTKVNGISAQDALIYDTATQIDSKVDIINTTVNNISAQDVLIYNAVSAMDSKVDLLKVFPDFVQTPTTFSSVSIEANTSRYFYQSATLQPLGNAELPILSIFNNSTSTIVRVSALGGGVVQNPSGVFGAVKFYKNATLTGANFSPVYSGESVMLQDTSATEFSGDKVVFQVANVFSTAGGAAALPLTFIPKESYCILVLPGETLTATVEPIGTGSTYQAIMLWEEIIA